MNKRLFLIILFFSCSSKADWYYYLSKIECSNETLKVVDYSAGNEEGLKRSKEANVISAEVLGVWETNQYGDRILIKSNSYIESCQIPSGKYKVTIKTGGGNPAWSQWFVVDISTGKTLFSSNITDPYNKKRELVFSKQYPQGKLVEE